MAPPFGTLYATESNPRIRKIRAAAAINGLELAFPADFQMYTSSRTPEYRAKFPLGKVPGFERQAADGDGAVFRLVESGAILQYVAESGPRRDQLLGGATAEARAHNAQWVLFNDLQLEATLRPLLGWRLGYLPRAADAAAAAAQEAEAAAELVRYLDFAERHLAAARGDGPEGAEPRAWFVHVDAEPGPSTADLVIGSVFALLCSAYVDAAMRAAYPALVRHLERLRRVPALGDLYVLPMIEKRQELEDPETQA